MLLGVIADDFTGAGDIANTLARGGLTTTQYLGIPRQAASPECEAGVVALKTRSVPAHEAVAQSLAALEWLRDQGCRQYVFKYCSTFDSTPAGNIGPVGEALASALDSAGVVACPAFPATGRAVFQGHLFVGAQLLSDSPLRDHPLNPMTDSDLRRWLRRQTAHPVGHVAWPTVTRGPAAIRDALAAAATRGEHLVIVDAVCDADLRAIGTACADATLLTGGSGVALGLPGNFLHAGLASGRTRRTGGVPGEGAILAGSCSQATLGQVKVHAASQPSLALDVEDVIGGKVGAADVVAFVRRHPGRAPLVYSSAAPEQVALSQARHGREATARAIEALFAESARQLVDEGISRLVVAGGETSGAVVSALELRHVEIGPEIDPGVPALFARGDRPLALALKSGNFGAPDFFGKALAVLERGS